MRKNLSFFLVSFCAVMLMGIGVVQAQVTTGSITGTATTDKGEGLVGAVITATHTPSGTVYTTIAKRGGNFNMPGLRVGGPYTITVTYVGLETKKYNDVYIQLGDPYNVDAVLKMAEQKLADVTVTAAGGKGVINSQRNGTSMNISNRIIQAVPTVNRSIQDVARLMPQVKVGNNGASGVTTGISFGGQNNRYNQFTIDGANANDGFGLGSTGTNGGQANLNPISMENIQEVQIVMSPYDVTQGGFTGGGINAVTKGGTNTIHGAVYGQTQNEGFVGKSVPYNSTITRAKMASFTNKTFGASLGGPIIKNKLFYYINYEKFDKSTPLAYDPTVSGSGSKVNSDTLAAIRTFINQTYHWDPGSYGAISNKNNSSSFFGRIDWNISDKHKLMLRYNYVKGHLDVLSRSATSAIFANSGYGFDDKQNSIVAELNSNFSSRVSNVLRLTGTFIRDSRTTADFPSISITNYNPTSAANISYSIGSDYSSIVNGLNQDVYTLTDNLSINLGKHVLTFGTDNQFYKSNNLYLQYFYGYYSYANGGTTTNNIANFENNTGLTGYSIGFSTSSTAGDKAPAILKAAQYSVYGQDVWSASKQFKLTYGLRIDVPIINTTPAANTGFNTAFASYGVTTNQVPATKLLLSPRIGFNYTLDGDEKVQFRGGLGIFTGRVPFVWISNQISNTAVTSVTSTFTAAQIAAYSVKFAYTSSDPHKGAFLGNLGNTSAPVINVIDKNFKYPQVFRANLALDKKFESLGGIIATVEAVYTKTLNNANYTNLNISDAGDATVQIMGSTRPYWNKFTNASYNNVLKLSNTSKGYGLNATVQIQKPASKDGWSGSIAYTFGTSTSLNDLTSSVAQSNWRAPLVISGLNHPDVAVSNFDMGSRIIGYISKQFKYAKRFATGFTLIYTGQSGQRLSYVIGNNIMGDYGIGGTSGSTTLAYVPSNFTEANFVDITGGKTASQQWADFVSFANNNKYLQRHMGQNTERNGDRLPFENHFDLRLTQDISFGKMKLQIFFDVLNVGNLLNKDWGWSYGGGDGFYTYSTTLFSVVTSGSQKRDGVAVTAAPTKTAPAFQFNINNFTNIKDKYRPYSVSDYTSRWSSQIGARFSF